MSKALITESYLTNIANAIRSKTGKSATLTPAQMAPEINSISVGTDVSDTTAAAANVLTGKYFYTSSGVKTQGTIATYNGAHHTSGYTVTISLSSNNYASNHKCEIWQINSTSVSEVDDTYDDITVLGETTDPDGTITVLVSETAISVFPVFYSDGMMVSINSTPTVTGDITVYDYSELNHPPYPTDGIFYFTVTSNGTISISGIDWDDD